MDGTNIRKAAARTDDSKRHAGFSLEKEQSSISLGRVFADLLFRVYPMK